MTDSHWSLWLVSHTGVEQGPYPVVGNLCVIERAPHGEWVSFKVTRRWGLDLPRWRGKDRSVGFNLTRECGFDDTLAITVPGDGYTIEITVRDL